MNTLNKIIKGFLITMIIICIISVVYLILIHNPGESYTEFYILGSDNTANNYPSNITLNSQKQVTIGIENHEHETQKYIIKLKKDNQTINEFNATLNNYDKLEIPYNLTADKKGENQTLTLDLYKEGIDAPYRTLNIRYNVTN
ncbi:MAG: DUF1616 domain-containing protein [Methanobacteriaceae archaeon]|nr:DUF1616 domain-containing protein [Methanobacteriaceae archaeon]